MEDLNFFYPHTCVIRRSTGQTDMLGNEGFDDVYKGICGLQRGGSGNTSLQGGRQYLDSPFIIIPESTIIVLTNDEVLVVDENGREMRFTATQSESFHDEDLKGTNIWLKVGDTINEA